MTNVLIVKQLLKKNLEILMGALARVFREDSKKNFELATNIANIFLQFSQYNQFQALISHYKVTTKIFRS